MPAQGRGQKSFSPCCAHCVENGLCVADAVCHRAVFQHGLVTGQFHVPARHSCHDVHERIEPLHTLRREQHRLKPQVSRADMTHLMFQNIRHVVRFRSFRQIYRRMQQTECKRNICFRGCVDFHISRHRRPGAVQADDKHQPAHRVHKRQPGRDRRPHKRQHRVERNRRGRFGHRQHLTGSAGRRAEYRDRFVPPFGEFERCGRLRQCELHRQRRTHGNNEPDYPERPGSNAAVAHPPDCKQHGDQRTQPRGNSQDRFKVSDHHFLPSPFGSVLPTRRYPHRTARSPAPAPQ